MGEMGYGYGSEWHLLRYLGRHRAFLDQQIESLEHLPRSNAAVLEWLDFHFDPSIWTLDKEWKAVDFLPEFSDASRAWQQFWPQQGEPPNWDAVGRIRVNGTVEWLLVEAKAHVCELRSNCGAAEHGGRPKIRRALNGTRHFIDGKEPNDVDASEQEIAHWMGPHYQYANRLTVLRFLLQHDIPTRLLLIYFYGDQSTQNDAPQSVDEWHHYLNPLKQHLVPRGLGGLSNYVHELFLPVCPGGQTPPLLRQFNWPSPRPLPPGRGAIPVPPTP